MSRAPHGPRARRKLRHFRPTIQALEARQLLAVSIADPGFESSLDGASNNSGFYYNPPGTPWTFDGLSGFVKGADQGTTPQGGQAALLQTNSSISQVVSTWEAGSYQVSFAAAQRASINTGVQDFQVLIDGVVVGLFQPSSASYHYYTTPSFTVAAGDHTLTFRGLNSVGGDNTVFLDDIAARPATPGVPIVHDSSFEMVAVGAQGFVYDASGSYWQFASLAGLTNDQSTFTYGNNAAAPDGTQMAFLQKSGSLIQTVVDWSTGTYQVSFSAAQRASINTSNQDFQVLLDDQVIGAFTPTSASFQTYTTADFAVTAGEHILGFRGLNTAGGDNTAFIDQVSVNRISATNPVGSQPNYELSATTFSASAIKLQWSLANFATGYTLERRTGGLGEWTYVAQVGQNVSSFLDTNLSESTTYEYRIRALSSSVPSDYGYSGIYLTRLTAPTGLVGTAVSKNQIDLTWSDNSTAESGYLVEASLDGATNWFQVGSPGAGSTSLTIMGTFAPATTYYYHVRAIAPANTSYDSISIAVSTRTVPASPVLTAVTAKSATSIALVWSDVADETSYRVDRSLDSGSTWNVAGISGADVTNFTDANLQSEQSYTYRVVASNAFGDSAPSNARFATTSLVAPDHLVATVSSATSINIFWSGVSGATGYVLEQSVNGTSDWQEATRPTSGTTSTVVRGLSPSTLYYFRIYATSATGNTPYSNIANASTGSASTISGPNVVSIVALDASAAEAGHDPATFRIFRTGSTASALTVAYSYSGTASYSSSDTDYSGLPMVGGSAGPNYQVTIPVGMAYADFSITPVTDILTEGIETVSISLKTGPNYGLADNSTATATITDDPSNNNVVSIVAIDSTAAEAGHDPASFRVSRTGSTAAALTVYYTFGGTASYASGDADYTGLPIYPYQNNFGTIYQVVIPAGAASTDFSITPIDDSTPEADETSIISLNASSYFTLDVRSIALVTISDNDGGATASQPPTVSIVAIDASASEVGRDPGTFRISRTGSTVSALIVYYTVGGTADGSDYSGLSYPPYAFSTTPVTILAGQSYLDLVLTPTIDTLVESSETVVVTLGSYRTYAVAADSSIATVTIADDPSNTNTVSIVAIDASASEVGRDPGTFRISRTGSTVSALIVYYTVGGTAGSSDYMGIGSGGSLYSVNIGNGLTYVDLTVTPTVDNLAEGSETVIISLVPLSSYALANNSAATIKISDASPDSPTNLIATLATPSRIDLSWTDADDEQGYRVERNRNGSTTWDLIATPTANATSYSDSSVLDGNQYSYRVFATRDSLQSNSTNTANITVPLIAPENLSVASISGGRIDLTWSDLSGSETSYLVEQSANGAAWQNLYPSASINATTFSVSGPFTASTMFYFRVRAYSSTTNVYSTYATTSVLSPAFPNTPVLTAAVAKSDSSILVTWTDLSNETGYRLERSDNNGTSWSRAVDNLAANTFSYTDTGLQEAKNYSYRLIALNAAGESAYSVVKTAATQPKAPTNPMVTFVSGSRIDLNWTDNSAAESSYSIERSLDNSNWQVLNPSAVANVENYRATGSFNPLTTYYFRIRAYSINLPSSSNYSQYSSVVSVSTPAFPRSPANVMAVVGSDTSIVVSWAEVSGANGYRIERSLSSANGWTTAGWVGAGVLTLSQTALTENTRYYFRVTAFNASGESATSTTANAVTQLASPDGVSVAFVSGHQINVTWADHSNFETGFIIEQSLDGMTGWTQAGTMAANATSFVAPGPFQPTTTYHFRVRAQSTATFPNLANNISASSAPVAVVTPDFPVAPMGLAVALTTTSSTTVTWDEVAGAINYRVERSLNGSTNWATVGAVRTTADLTDSGLTLGVRYFYRVFAANTAGESSSSAVVSLVVKNLEAYTDRYAVGHDRSLTRTAINGVLSNDVDANKEPLSAVLVADVQHGTLYLGADGGFIYIPEPGFASVDSFSYRASNGSLESSVVVVMIDVTEQAPVAVADRYFARSGQVLIVNSGGVLFNDTDAESDPLTAALVATAQHGTLDLHADGTFTYTPTADYSGTDSFTYQASDGTLTSNTATVTITVTATAPVAVADRYYARSGQALAVATGGVLFNDTDAESDPLTAALVATAQHGTLDLHADGTFTYTPTAGYSGTDSFSYQASDGTLTSNTATVSISVSGGAPVARADTYAGRAGHALAVLAGGVLFNDTDAESDPLTAALVATAQHGTLDLHADGTFTYTPTADYSGTDSFTYQASDGTLTSNTATVTITVTATAPVAVADRYYARSGQALAVATGGVLFNDTDAESDPLTAALVATAQHGTLDLHADGTFTYTPTAGYSGTDSFSYQASDGTLTSNTATVTITVVNQAAVAAYDSYEVAAGGRLIVLPGEGILENDTSIDGDVLTAVLVTTVAHGILTLNSDGTFDYSPAAGYSGTDSFTYRANDGTEDTDLAIVTITVIRQVPRASNDFYSVTSGQSLVVPYSQGLLANDSGTNGTSLTATLVSNVHAGTLQLQANGTFSYVPSAGFSGTDSFTYKVNDGFLDSTTATVNIVVMPPSTATSEGSMGTPGYSASFPGLVPSASSILTTIAPGSPIQGAAFAGLASITSDNFSVGFHGASAITTTTASNSGLGWATPTTTASLGLGGYPGGYGFGVGSYLTGYGYGYGGYLGGYGGYVDLIELSGYGQGGYLGVYGDPGWGIGQYGFAGIGDYDLERSGSDGNTTWSATLRGSSDMYFYSYVHMTSSMGSIVVENHTYKFIRTDEVEGSGTRDGAGNSSYSYKNSFSTSYIDEYEDVGSDTDNSWTHSWTTEGEYESSGESSPESKSSSSRYSEAGSESFTQDRSSSSTSPNQSQWTAGHAEFSAAYSARGDTSYEFNSNSGSTSSSSRFFNNSGSGSTSTESGSTSTTQTATTSGNETRLSKTKGSQSFSNASSASGSSGPNGNTSTSSSSHSDDGSNSVSNTVKGHFENVNATGNPASGNTSRTEGAVEYARANGSTADFSNSNSNQNDFKDGVNTSKSSTDHKDSGDRWATFNLQGSAKFTEQSSKPSAGETAASEGSETYFQKASSSDRYANSSTSKSSSDGRGQTNSTQNSSRTADGKIESAYGVVGSLDYVRTSRSVQDGSNEVTQGTDQYVLSAKSNQVFNDQTTTTAEPGSSTSTTKHSDSGTDSTLTTDGIAETYIAIVVDPETGDVSRSTSSSTSDYSDVVTDEFANRSMKGTVTTGKTTTQSSSITHSDSGTEVNTSIDQSDDSSTSLSADGLTTTEDISHLTSNLTSTDQWDNQAAKTVEAGVTVSTSNQTTSGSSNSTRSESGSGTASQPAIGDLGLFLETYDYAIEETYGDEYENHVASGVTESGKDRNATNTSSENGSSTANRTAERSTAASQPSADGGMATDSATESVHEAAQDQYQNDYGQTEIVTASLKTLVTTSSYSGSGSDTFTKQGAQSTSGSLNGALRSTAHSYDDHEETDTSNSGESNVSQTFTAGQVLDERTSTSNESELVQTTKHEQETNSVVHPSYALIFSATSDDQSTTQVTTAVASSLSNRDGIIAGSTSVDASQSETSSSILTQLGGFRKTVSTDSGIAEITGSFQVTETSGRTKDLTSLAHVDEGSGSGSRTQFQTLHETGFHSLDQSDLGTNVYEGISQGGESYQGNGSFDETDHGDSSFVFHETSDLNFDLAGNASGTIQSNLTQIESWSNSRHQTDSLGVEGSGVDTILLGTLGSGTRHSQEDRFEVITSNQSMMSDTEVVQTLASSTAATGNSESDYSETTDVDSTVTTVVNGPAGTLPVRTVSGGSTTTHTGTLTTAIEAARQADTLGGGTRDVLDMLLTLLTQTYSTSDDGVAGPSANRYFSAHTSGNMQSISEPALSAPQPASEGGVSTQPNSEPTHPTPQPASEDGVWQWLVGSASYVYTKVDQFHGVVGNLVLTGTLVRMDSTSGSELLNSAAIAATTTGGKVVVNSAATAARSTLTLGIYGDHWELIPVNETDRARAYDLTSGLTGGLFEVAIALGTGGAAATLAKGGRISRAVSGSILLIDASGSVVGVMKARDQILEEGASRANLLKLAFNLVALGVSPVPKAALGSYLDVGIKSLRTSKLFSGLDPTDFGKAFVKRLVPNAVLIKGRRARDILAEKLGANPYPVKSEAHHILGVDQFDTPLAIRLHNWGIDLNGLENGVLLPKYDYVDRIASIHRGRTAGAYTEAVTKRLNEATSKEEALEILADLKEELMSGQLKINNAT